MIAKEWLDEQKSLIVEYYDEEFLYCKLDERVVNIEISKFTDGTYATNIFFTENDIQIFHFLDG